MHEASIVANLIHNVCGIAAANRLVRVTEVRVLIGRMHHIAPDVLRQQFQMQKKRRPLLARARLVVEAQEIVIRCRACGAESPLAEINFACPACGSADVQMISGTDLHIVDLSGKK